MSAESVEVADFSRYARQPELAFEYSAGDLDIRLAVERTAADQGLGNHHAEPRRRRSQPFAATKCLSDSAGRFTVLAKRCCRRRRNSGRVLQSAFQNYCEPQTAPHPSESERTMDRIREHSRVGRAVT